MARKYDWLAATSITAVSAPIFRKKILFYGFKTAIKSCVGTGSENKKTTQGDLSRSDQMGVGSGRKPVKLVDDYIRLGRGQDDVKIELAGLNPSITLPRPLLIIRTSLIENHDPVKVTTRGWLMFGGREE